ncbi:MAG: IS256 family transposase [Acidimicrobiia bacterium]|nr:IS256 family transposase [Acidimicrobiia bacterium]
MTLSDTATAQLWESFRAGGGASLVREAVELVLQELIEAEATEAIGAGRYERTDARVTARNGHRARLLATRAGDVNLKIPKLRKGSFFPSIIEPRRRIDRALWAVVMEAYVAGVSTRSVDDLVAALGANSGISKSEVSRICGGLDEVVEAFRGRRLDHVEFPYVYLDATYLNVRNNLAQPASMATVVATGITADGNREVLGCDVGDSESEGFWQQFLASLRERGLSGVRLVVSDAHRGLAAAADRWFQGAARQRCRVHFIRNLLAAVPKSHQHMAAALFRTIFAQPDAGAVADAWDQVGDQLAGRFAKIGPLMEHAKADVLAFAAFPRSHWQKIWSTNPLERINKEIKRRSRVVGIFPNEASAVRLVGAILADLHDEWQATDRRYLSEDSMSLLYPQRDSLATAELTVGNHHRGSTQKPTT